VSEHEEAVQAWLESVGLTANDDPNVPVLVDTARDLDRLDGLGLEPKDDIAARKSLRYTLQQSRKHLETVLAKADSARSRGRTTALFGKLAQEMLGWVDLDMLSPELREQVLAELEENHGICAVEYTETVVQL